jgi:hypothetical protein
MIQGKVWDVNEVWFKSFIFEFIYFLLLNVERVQIDKLWRMNFNNFFFAKG